MLTSSVACACAGPRRRSLRPSRTPSPRAVPRRKRRRAKLDILFYSFKCALRLALKHLVAQSIAHTWLQTAFCHTCCCYFPPWVPRAGATVGHDSRCSCVGGHPPRQLQLRQLPTWPACHHSCAWQQGAEPLPGRCHKRWRRAANPPSAPQLRISEHSLGHGGAASTPLQPAAPSCVQGLQQALHQQSTLPGCARTACTHRPRHRHQGQLLAAKQAAPHLQSRSLTTRPSQQAATKSHSLGCQPRWSRCV